MAGAARHMQIHLTDGSKETLAVAQIDSITFKEIEPGMHADVMVAWADADSIFVADSLGQNGQVIALPFPVDGPVELWRVAIGPGNSEYCFYVQWRDAGQLDTLYIVDDLSGANLRKIPQSYQETLRDMCYTPSGDLTLAYYNGSSELPVYRLDRQQNALTEVWDMGDELSNISDVDFDAEGRMYALDGGSSRMYRFASEEGGSPEVLYADSLVSNPDDPEFTELNSFDIDRVSGVLYIDANYETAYTEHDEHFWVQVPDFTGEGATFTRGFQLNSGGGDFLQGWNGQTFFVYDDDDGAAYGYSDFTDSESGALLIDRPNIRDIAVKDE
jgi:hypothetical protein